LVRKFYQYFFPKYAAKANKILTVSNFTKEDLIKTYKIVDKRIDTAYCGISNKYFPISKDEKKKISTQYANGEQYFIAIGSINPRKNLDKTIEAFDIFKKKTNSSQKLMIVGAKGWKTGAFFKAYENSNFKNDIILTGHLMPEKLNKVLGSATALIFTSLFEGFGIPIVEAFKAEIPVITSNVSSMPEVAEDAAILVNPKAVKAIADAMEKVEQNKNLKTELIEKGKARAKDFNWDKTAEKVKIELENILKIERQII
jgi:glycosyltransferase involved in cell wall biosynthesis